MKMTLLFLSTFLTLFTFSTTELQILNYTLSHLVTIFSGPAKIQDGTFNIIHIIEMDRYKNFVDDVQKEIVQTIPKSNPFFPLLTHEISQIHDILEGIEPMEPPRKKRSINILGTAWKYIAGSPDHDDFVTVKNALDQTILNNNQQVVINDIFTERLQNLTQITNHITKAIKDNKDFVNEAALSMQIKLRFIKEE
ncbi:uncharacterized protein LOC131800868 [Musca domestica]|nr:uncharacterized protein LOC131800868 [Musca domestica]